VRLRLARSMPAWQRLRKQGQARSFQFEPRCAAGWEVCSVRGTGIIVAR
jgi:hypothetical protein